MTIIKVIGAISLGVFIGWLVMFFVRRFKEFNPGVLATLISAFLISNGALAFVFKDNDAMWLYCIGLLVGGGLHTLVSLKAGIPPEQVMYVTEELEKEQVMESQTKSQNVYPSEETQFYIEKQARLFEQHRDKLIAQYLGKYVLFEDGAVIDCGEDKITLTKAAYKKGGSRPLFIKKVVKETPKPTVWTAIPIGDMDV